MSNHTSDSATLTWRAPEKDGGSKVTHYILEVKEGSDIKYKVKEKRVTSLSCDVSGLREGVVYEFRVTAVNHVGEGMPSGPSQPTKYGNYVTILTDLGFILIEYCIFYPM